MHLSKIHPRLIKPQGRVVGKVGYCKNQTNNSTPIKLFVLVNTGEPELKKLFVRALKSQFKRVKWKENYATFEYKIEGRLRKPKRLLNFLGDVISASLNAEEAWDISNTLY